MDVEDKSFRTQTIRSVLGKNAKLSRGKLAEFGITSASNRNVSRLAPERPAKLPGTRPPYLSYLLSLVNLMSLVKGVHSAAVHDTCTVWY